MKTTMVKICGLRRPEDAQAANHLKPDLAGFILSPGFRRSIDTEQAKALRRILSPEIRTVGVFVDAPYEDILQAAEGGCIDMIQLHGKEDDAYISGLAALTELPLIKAFRVSEKKDLEAAAASTAQWILLDSGTGTGKRFDWELLESFLQESAENANSPKAEESAELPEIVQDVKSAETADLSEMAENPASAETADLSEMAENPASAEPTEKGIHMRNLFPGGHPWLLAGGLSAENVGAAIGRFHPAAVDVSSKVETDGIKDPAKMAAFIAAARAD